MRTTSLSTLSTCTPVRHSTRPSTRPLLKYLQTEIIPAPIHRMCLSVLCRNRRRLQNVFDTKNELAETLTKGNFTVKSRLVSWISRSLSAHQSPILGSCISCSPGNHRLGRNSARTSAERSVRDRVEKLSVKFSSVAQR